MGMRKYPFVTIFLALFFFLLLAKPHYFDMSLNRFVSVDTTKLQTIASKKIATLKGSPLVVSGANYEYVSTELLPNFLCSVREASPETQKHLLFFPLDLKTNSFLSTKFPKINTFSSQRYWDITQKPLRHFTSATRSYHFFLMKKALFLEETLKQTPLDIIWTDSDLVWLEDVREWFINLPEKGCDIMFSDDKRNSTDLSSPNAGVYYARNTPSTRKLFQLWREDLFNYWKKRIRTREQDALKRAILNISTYYQTSRRFWGNYPQTTSPDKLTICFLPQDKFPHYSETWEKEGNKENVVVVHPNVFRKESKDQILRNGFWFWDSKQGCVERFNQSLVESTKEEREE